VTADGAQSALDHHLHRLGQAACPPLRHTGTVRRQVIACQRVEDCRGAPAGPGESAMPSAGLCLHLGPARCGAVSALAAVAHLVAPRHVAGGGRGGAGGVRTT
jgi:hypothetical protein